MRGNLHSDSRLDLFEFIFGFSRISYLFATTYDMYIYICTWNPNGAPCFDWSLGLVWKVFQPKYYIFQCEQTAFWLEMYV